MRIRDRQIEVGREPYVIAELGVNHDGDVERALELVEHAARAGADAVKTQHFRADMLLARGASLTSSQREASESDPRDMLARLELDPKDQLTIAQCAWDHDMAWVVTVFSPELVEEVDRIPPDAYKIASPDIVHRPLIETIERTGRPLILSTGASTMDEVRRAAEWLARARKGERVAMLQCVSAYPTPNDQASIEGVLALWREFGDPVGYSDHTTSTSIGYDVVRGRGIIVEKHLTYDRTALGPDHAMSLDPVEFKRYCTLTKSVLTDSMGLSETLPLPDAAKGPLTIESEVREQSRQSIVARRAISAGARLAREDLTFKRPGTGLEPWRIDELVGRRVKRDVEGDALITPEDIV